MKKSELKQLIQEVINESKTADFYLEIEEFINSLSQKYNLQNKDMAKRIIPVIETIFELHK